MDTHAHNHDPKQPVNVLSAPRPWTRLSLADRARVVERCEAGEAPTSLAAELGVAKSTILANLREANVVVRRQPLTSQQVSEAAALYESACSLSPIAAKTTLEQDTIRDDDALHHDVLLLCACGREPEWFSWNRGAQTTWRDRERGIGRERPAIYLLTWTCSSRPPAETRCLKLLRPSPAISSALRRRRRWR